MNIDALLRSSPSSRAEQLIEDALVNADERTARDGEVILDTTTALLASIACSLVKIATYGVVAYTENRE